MLINIGVNEMPKTFLMVISFDFDNVSSDFIGATLFDFVN